MPKHQYLEKLCAMALLGDLPADQAQEFELHLSTCETCRQRSAEYWQIQQKLVEAAHWERDAGIESSRNRVKAAMWAKITRIDTVLTPKRHRIPFQPILSTLQNHKFVSSFGIGAGFVVTAGLIFWLGIQYDHKFDLHATGISSAGVRPVMPPPPQPMTQRTTDSLQKLEAEYRDLATSFELERRRRQDLEQELASKDRELTQAIAAQASLQEQFDREAATLKTTQAELDAKMTALNLAQSTNLADGTTIALLENQIHDLTTRLTTESTSLERERDMLSYGRQIRDIIGARNLHVVDVYDMGSEGTVKKPFARAFYTEGKSLVYYAFDLPERKIDRDKFSYVAWGENSRSGTTVKKIGILYQDDGNQRRWNLIYKDPQVLKEIDSVFITLERTDEDVANPKGKRMLTAYLGTTANHP